MTTDEGLERLEQTVIAQGDPADQHPLHLDDAN